MSGLKPILARLGRGETLSAAQAEEAFGLIMDGAASEGQIAGLLMAMRARGETVAELTGAVTAMRARMVKVEIPPGAIDVCGTGGDAAASLNISTAVTLVLAACGVPVAKHGNRAASSKSGASDALTALGVRIGLPPEGVERCIAQAGIGFMMAPTHHAAMRHVGAARVELGTRTIFNLLGPLSNPAGVKRQVIGVFSSAWLEPMAKVLRNHGSERVWLCHGGDGLDEITTTAPTEIVELRNGEIRTFTIEPEDVGLRRAAPAELKGGDPATNAEALRAVLAGARNGYRDIALLNAAAALVVADRAQNLADGVRRAARAVDEGAAAATLAKLAEVSNA
jgi:anthranilate phosphoribosyltransferase